MELKVGGDYRTRGGQEVHIIARGEKATGENFYLGYVVSEGPRKDCRWEQSGACDDDVNYDIKQEG